MTKLLVRAKEYNSTHTNIRTNWWNLPSSTDVPTKIKYAVTPSSKNDLAAKMPTAAYNLMLASESVLAKLWDTPEEDEAWEDL